MGSALLLRSQTFKTTGDNWQTAVPNMNMVTDALITLV
jgi:hypothetical protein